MIQDSYKKLASLQLEGAGIKKLPPEVAQQAIEEVAYGMIFKSVGIISKKQLSEIIKRNTDHTEKMVRHFTEVKG